MRPSIILSVVVFPAPFGPSRPKISPAGSTDRGRPPRPSGRCRDGRETISSTPRSRRRRTSATPPFGSRKSNSFFESARQGATGTWRWRQTPRPRADRRRSPRRGGAFPRCRTRPTDVPAPPSQSTGGTLRVSRQSDDRRGRGRRDGRGTRRPDTPSETTPDRRRVRHHDGNGRGHRLQHRAGQPLEA